jgi:hypothetical protein
MSSRGRDHRLAGRSRVMRCCFSIFGLASGRTRRTSRAGWTGQAVRRGQAPAGPGAGALHLTCVPGIAEGSLGIAWAGSAMRSFGAVARRLRCDGVAGARRGPGSGMATCRGSALQLQAGGLGAGVGCRGSSLPGRHRPAASWNGVPGQAGAGDAQGRGSASA